MTTTPQQDHNLRIGLALLAAADPSWLATWVEIRALPETSA